MADWIVTSSVLILIIAVLRRLLRGKISLCLQYALWAVVLLRLLVPVQLGQTSFSVLNAVEGRQELQITVTEPLFYIGETPDLAPPEVEDSTLTEAERTAQEQQMYLEYLEEMAKFATPVSLSTALRIVWIAGITVTSAVFLAGNLRLSRRLRRSRRETELQCGSLRVYVSLLVETPCLFGLFRPAVYVTEEVLRDETALRHALAHEETHHRHGDHLWAALRGLCLALHWYNPLVWLAAALSRRDGELACDEGTLQRLGQTERIAYGETLIALTCGRRTKLLLTATTMTGSKRTLRERILLIAKRPKMAVRTLITALLVVAVAAGCTFTGRKASDPSTELVWFYVGDAAVETQVLSAVHTYITAHAAILNELTEPGFITGATIYSVTDDPAGSSAENGLCLYTVSYKLHCDDQPRLGVLSGDVCFTDKWQAEGTNGGVPQLTEALEMGTDIERLAYLFRAEVLAPCGGQEGAIDSGRAVVPVTYVDSWRLPDAVVASAAEWVAERADIINGLVAAPDFVTDAEIIRLEPIDTASASETVHIRLYHLDYRLRLRIPDAVNMDLNGMNYQEDGGSVWLVEPDTGSTPVLVMEHRVNEGSWSRLGILYTGEIDANYDGDCTRAAVEFYESVRSSGH